MSFSLDRRTWRALGLVLALVASLLALGSATAPPAAAAGKNVCVFTPTSDTGLADHVPVVAATGDTAVEITDVAAATLANCDMVWAERPNSGVMPASWNDNRADLDAAVDAGMPLVIFDWNPSGAQFIPGFDTAGSCVEDFSDDADIDLLNTNTPVTDGVGGVLTDASLDGGTSSTHGFCAGTLPPGATRLMSTSTPAEVTAFSYLYGNGMVFYSTTPASYYVGGSGPASMQTAVNDILLPNVIDWMLELQTGQTFTVDALVDTLDAAVGDGVCADGAGRCSLRAAVAEANVGSSSDEIILPMGTIALTRSGLDDDNRLGDIDIVGPTTVWGGYTTIDAAPGGDRALHVFNAGPGPNAALDQLEVTGGDGGYGGGLFASGRVMVTNSTFWGNTSSNYGGGIGSSGPAVMLENVTITANVGQDSDGGGGLDIEAGAAVVNHLTVVDNENTAGGPGGAWINPDDPSTVTNSLFAFNVTANVSEGVDCQFDTALVDVDDSFIRDGRNCGVPHGTDGNRVGNGPNPLDPGLGPLETGDAVPTIPPLEGSPLVDTAADATCAATDARGVVRPQFAGCDVGAHELSAPEYVALVPARLLDTRSGFGVAADPLGPATTIELQVTGRGGVPADGVGAVALNVTSTESTTPSFVTVWPTGSPRPNASNLNTDPGQDTPNLVIVRLGAGGKVSLYNNAGTGHLVADVQGYFPIGSSFVSQNPARILDTRNGVGAPAAPLGPQGRVDLTVTGAGGLPGSGVGAVVMNVTSTESTTPSFVTVWPTGATRPTASNLNTEPGQDTPNLVMVKVGDGGAVSLFNNAGTGELVGDVLGWFPTGSPFTALTPVRILDTRNGNGAPEGLVQPGQTVNLQVAGRAGLPGTGVGAVVLNVTSTVSDTPSFVTVWPGGTPQPNASNLNTEPGQDTPNLVIVKVGGDGTVNLYNNAGQGHLVADLLGWFPAE